jgi:hypothetical protein
MNTAQQATVLSQRHGKRMRLNRRSVAGNIEDVPCEELVRAN